MFDKKCPKCKSEKLTKEYHVSQDHNSYKFSCGDKSVNSSNKEHLHFYCEDCNYDWIEDVAKG